MAGYNNENAVSGGGDGQITIHRLLSLKARALWRLAAGSDDDRQEKRLARLKRRYGGPAAPGGSFIIWRKTKSVGLFSNVYVFLGQMLSAEKKGLVPVVDMQNFDNIYLARGELGRRNSWEYYFLQPGGRGPKEAYASGGVTFSGGGSAEDVDLFPAGFAWQEDAETLRHWREVYRRHIRLNPETKAHIERARQRYFQGVGRVLGLLCRGTDYNAATAAGHSVQPSVEMIIQKAEEMRRAHGCERVYAATEDADILRRLEDHFGGALFYTPSRRISAAQLKTTALADKGKANRREDGLNYLTDIALLSHCDCLLAGRVSATPFVFLNRETPFDAHYIWDLGVFP